jgi:SOS response regulatory protein OraA/RecX
VPRVTALRERRSGYVVVELDGAPWRTLPPDVVVRAGLCPGLELDREHLRTVRRELRRAEALGAAVRALRHGDLSRAALEARLERRRVDPGVRGEALSTLERAGYVDDRRAAAARARTLAERGSGDAAIAHDLAARGFGDEDARAAVAALEPEPERARRLAHERGATLKTARWLAGRGFAPESIEGALRGVIAPDA